MYIPPYLSNGTAQVLRLLLHVVVDHLKGGGKRGVSEAKGGQQRAGGGTSHEQEGEAQVHPRLPTRQSLASALTTELLILPPPGRLTGAENGAVSPPIPLQSICGTNMSG